jgi:hypothetical protein
MTRAKSPRRQPPLGNEAQLIRRNVATFATFSPLHWEEISIDHGYFASGRFHLIKASNNGLDQSLDACGQCSKMCDHQERPG